MDIEISGVLREGDECIILKVVDDCNLWPYVLKRVRGQRVRGQVPEPFEFHESNE